MKKHFLSVLVALISFVGISAQDWSITFRSIDGLPGSQGSYMGKEYHTFVSPLMTPGTSVDRVRITVVETTSNEAPNGNNVIFALSDLIVFDGDGNRVDYIAYSNADHNSLWWETDGGGLEALGDDDLGSYFHSMWQTPGVSDYHYIELSLARSVETFKLQWSTRLGEGKNDPTSVGITLGTPYIPSDVTADFALGDVVADEAELAAANTLFVLRGNAVKSFSTSNGTTFTGRGPLYMRCAEEGDREVSLEHVMQVIPADDGRYLIYWPVSGKFLKNSNSSTEYNGLNGWQYSTSEFYNAALVRFVPTDDGFFGIQYDCSYMGSTLTLNVGAELRDGVYSKMKTFDNEHKQALEKGDYTQGYSLPIAFNWSIYKAVLDDETVKELSVTIPQLARSYLQPYITSAAGYLATYGDHGGYCISGEDKTLNTTIRSAEYVMDYAKSISSILNIEGTLFRDLSYYMAARLRKYDSEVASLLSTSQFTSYPYSAGTYPESSRTILEALQTTIDDAWSKAGLYSASQYEGIYSQIEDEIARFLATKVDEQPDSGDEEDAPEEDMIYLYLSGGGIDAFLPSALDGDYYYEEGYICFPLKDAEVIRYAPEEFDSCSAVRPQLPVMTSYKFNNKYNPNLNVDVEADSVVRNMRFNINAIGKWLTASFQLDDEKAVAFVDTVLQVSKVTRQSFADRVKYKVTYPGYNVVEHVKVQDEVWYTPSQDGEVVEVPLDANMLYTNKPSQYESESLANLLDGDPSTIFHSTWGSANNATVNVNTYITIDLPQTLDDIRLYYRCRPQSGYNPLVLEIYAGNGNDEWTLLRTLDYTADNMPTGGAGQEYTSPTISLGGNYTKLKILQTRGEYSKNHMALSELRLYKVTETVTGEPVKIQDAVYATRRIPFGNEYNVKVNWLTDNAVSVPRIDVDIEYGRFVTSKDYYLKAKFRITGYGVYENFEDSVQIKGRGNSSWGYSKKPYRLKFAEKVKPFGLTKGKSWVLLANAQKGSLMANAIAMKIGQMAGTSYANHIIPVELYMNGRYMGSYMFTEKVGMANNSVDLDESEAYLLELDTYGSSDEPIYRTGVYNLPVKVSEPDLADLPADSALVRKNRMLEDVREMSSAIYDGTGIESVLDIDATARFFLANDLSGNQEINHPKSTYLFRNEVDPNSKLTFGPIWDFDWGFGYEGSASYCYTGATSDIVNVNMDAWRFWSDLTKSDIFKKHYYRVWKEFIEKRSIEELADYMDSYYRFAKSSFDNNATEWGASTTFDESDVERAKEWIEQRKDYIYGGLDEYELDDLIYPLKGDVNCNNQVTIHDATLVAAYLNGDVLEDFSEVKADCDGNGTIDEEDVAEAALIALESEAPSPMYWYNTPVASGELGATAFSMELGEDTEVAVGLTANGEEKYTSVQFDVKVPDGLFIYDALPGEMIPEHNFLYAQLDMNTYRVVAYDDYCNLFDMSGREIVRLVLNASSVIDETLRRIEVSNIYVVDKNNDELRLGDLAITFSQETGISGKYMSYSVKGGDCITVTALEPQEVAVYSVDGRLLHKTVVQQGTTRFDVHPGLYIVNGAKVSVR